MRVLRAHILVMVFLLTAQIGWSSGRYTINAEQTQVELAEGNLQLTAHSDTWSFGAPTDFIGDAGVLGGAPSNKLDLFGWSGDTYKLWGVSALTVPSVYGGEFLDWGTHTIGTDAAGTWSTLTAEEWSYILTGRYNAANLNGYATINGISGLIILCDSSDQILQPSYTTDQWNALQANGAVFLPIAGERIGGQTVDNTVGAYWTATAEGADQAKSILIQSSGASLINRERARGGAVRLAKRLARTIEVLPDGCYEFDSWPDGNTDNPRTFGPGEQILEPQMRPIVRTITGAVEAGSVGFGTVSISIVE